MSSSFLLTLTLAVICLLCLGKLPLVAADPIDSAKCPTGWTEFNCHCYRVSSRIADYATAQRECTALSGDLVHIDSADENLFVANLLMRNQGPGVPGGNSLCGGVHESAWIGLNDIQENGVMRWYKTDMVPYYTNWLMTQPDDTTGQENCVELYNSKHSTLAYHWNDVRCDCKKDYVCELRPPGTRDACCGLNF